MPKATIRTYGSFNVNETMINVSKITCEDAYVADISKEVSFGKYSKKLPLHGKVKDTDLGRE